MKTDYTIYENKIINYLKNNDFILVWQAAFLLRREIPQARTVLIRLRKQGKLNVIFSNKILSISQNTLKSVYYIGEWTDRKNQAAKKALKKGTQVMIRPQQIIEEPFVPMDIKSYLEGLTR